ncbi:MAG: OmpA family protein [Pseudomonadota bacterium]
MSLARRLIVVFILVCGNAWATGADQDFDGVEDAADQCPGTTRGANVDEAGCASDLDGDGVADSADRCVRTPAGIKVNLYGCPMDADNDGVADVYDLCPKTKAGATANSAGCGPAQTVVLEGVNFERNSARLTPDSRRVLEEVVTKLRDKPHLKVEVAGHTDDHGPDRINRTLSQRRAESVRAYLRGLGIPEQQLSAKGYGADAPRASNTTEEGRAANRRVELRVE